MKKEGGKMERRMDGMDRKRKNGRGDADFRRLIMKRDDLFL
jgi:hypothetical protein